MPFLFYLKWVVKLAIIIIENISISIGGFLIKSRFAFMTHVWVQNSILSINYSLQIYQVTLKSYF